MSTLDKCTSPVEWKCDKLNTLWRSSKCQQELRYSRILGSATGSTKYSKKNLQKYVDKWEKFLKGYFERYDLTDNTNSDRYCVLQEDILNTCVESTTSPLCSHYLDEACKRYEREEVNQSRTLSSACGCRVPPDDSYLKYTKRAECDPMCNRVTVAQRVNSDTGKETRCSADVCVINDVTVKLYQTKVKGGVALNQICGHCGKNGCTCIISGVSIPQVMRDSSLETAYSQFCSGNSVCLQRDNSGGPDKVMDCSAALETAKKLAYTKSVGGPLWYVIFVGVLLLSVAILLFVFCKANGRAR